MDARFGQSAESVDSSQVNDAMALMVRVKDLFAKCILKYHSLFLSFFCGGFAVLNSCLSCVDHYSHDLLLIGLSSCCSLPSITPHKRVSKDCLAVLLLSNFKFPYINTTLRIDCSQGAVVRFPAHFTHALTHECSPQRVAIPILI